MAFGPGATGHTGNVTECPTEPRKWLRMPGAVPGDVEVSFRCKLSINSRQRQSPTFELSRPVCRRPLTCQQGSPQHARGATALREEAGAAAEPRGPPDTAPRGLRYDAHRAPCWRGAEPDSRGGWGVRAQASRLRPPNLGGFFQGQRDRGRSSLTRRAPNPGLSRPFQAFPEPECPLVLPFAPLTPGTTFFANRPGLGVHGPWSPCFPGLTPTQGPWGRDRPWIEAQRPAQGRALSRESGAPRPPPRAQLGHRPRSPACPRAALELEVTEGPEDSSAQTPAGTGAPCPVATGSS